MAKTDKAEASFPSDAEIAVANARGEELYRTQPRAVAARYNPLTGHVEVDLASGATFSFPVALVQGLAGADPDALSEIEVMGVGFGLGWDRLDAHYTVAGLMNGIFGTRAFMAAQAGRAKSEAKAAAARSNGKKGGRPRRAA
ncbi:MAG: DUF2442 domain-containing protein [Sphingopyxis sp.]|nr:DUF2442 domain-containing protein [Sphingopyxis sp.]